MRALTLVAVLALVFGCGCHAAAGWHWVWDGSCDPTCVGTQDGVWAFDRGGEGYDSVEPGRECYFEIVDNGSGGRAIRVVDNSWEGGSPAGNAYLKWYPHCIDRGIPPGSVPALEDNRPDCTGGTFTMRFKVASFTPRITNPTKTKQFVAIIYNYLADDPGTPEAVPVVKGAKLDIWSGSPGGAAGQWGMTADLGWICDSSGNWNFCDDRWHTLWIRITPESNDPAGYPARSRFTVYIDGQPAQTTGGTPYEYWRAGGGVSGKIGWEHGDDAIVGYIDHVAFAYQPYDVDTLPIPSDSPRKFTGSNNIGVSKTFADTTEFGLAAQPFMAGKYVNQNVRHHIGGTHTGPRTKEVYYVEQDRRMAGTFVYPNGNTVDWLGNPTVIAPGDRINAYGSMGTILGERALVAWKIVKLDPAAYPPTEANIPVGLGNKAVVKSFDKSWLDVAGIRATVWGEVTYLDYAGFLFIDDGINYLEGNRYVDGDGEPVRGVRVLFDPLNPPDVFEGDYMSVTGCIGTSRYVDTNPPRIDKAVPCVFLDSYETFPY